MKKTRTNMSLVLKNATCKYCLKGNPKSIKKVSQNISASKNFALEIVSLKIVGLKDKNFIKSVYSKIVATIRTGKFSNFLECVKQLNMFEPPSGINIPNSPTKNMGVFSIKRY